MLTPQAIHLGPMMLPWELVIPLLSLIISLVIAKQFKPKYQVSAVQWNLLKDSIWTAILIGLVFARIGFVLMHLSSYLTDPIEIIKIQDKGFNLYVGLLVGCSWFIVKNKALQKLFLTLLFSLFILFNTVGFGILHKVQQQYQQFPDVALQDLQHNPVSLKQFAGKPLVINLWASWCPPCHREMPLLNQAQTDYQDVQFVFINQGEAAEIIQAYLQKNQLQLQHVLLDPQGLTAQTMGMYGMPSTLFFDAHGKLLDTHMGEISHAVLAQKIQKISLK